MVQDGEKKHSRLLREFTGVMLIGILAFGFLSLVTFDRGDLTSWQNPPNSTLTNVCGNAGAWLASALYQWFGIGSYVLLVIAGTWAARLFRRAEVRDPWFKAFGTSLLAVISCAGLNLLPGASATEIMPGFGGIAGVALTTVFGSYLGPAGTVLMVGTLFILSFLLATDLMLEDVAVASAGLVRKARKRLARPGAGPRNEPGTTGSPGQSGSSPQAAAYQPTVVKPQRDKSLASRKGSRKPRQGESSQDPESKPMAGPPLNLSKPIEDVPVIDGVPADDVSSNNSGSPVPPDDPHPFPTVVPRILDGLKKQDGLPSLNFSQMGLDEDSHVGDVPSPIPADISHDLEHPLPSEEDLDENDSGMVGDDTVNHLLQAIQQQAEDRRHQDPAAQSVSQEGNTPGVKGEDDVLTSVSSVGADSLEADSESPDASAREMEDEEFPAEGSDVEALDNVNLEDRMLEMRKKMAEDGQGLKAPNARQRKKGKYVLPDMEMLEQPSTPRGRELESRQMIQQLERALQDFKVGAEVVDIQRGPTVTMLEIALSPGVKVNKIINLSDDLAIAMRAQSVRIVAPIPGKSTVGIEIPNNVKEMVRLRELMVCPDAQKEDIELPLFLGKDVAGSPVISDLTKMPHLLIAGATGAGKSVCINSIISSILMTQTPDDVRMVLIDPKMVELSGFEHIPHLLAPVVTDMKKAPGVLEWAVKKMDERYDMLAAVGVRHIKQFNQLGEDKIRKRLAYRGGIADDFPFHLPYIIIVVDEYADLMMVSGKELEKSITRLAQKSRAVGIHVILATQRPSVDVITGLIKSNMPSRIAFMVTSKVDSRTILDRNGAEKLVGMGDMLFLPPGRSDPSRCQGVFLSEEELYSIVEHLRDQDNPEFESELEDLDGTDASGEDFSDRDNLYEQAVRIVLQSGRGSVSLLQRKLEIGYTRAARLMDFMAKDGIVGGYKGSKAREVAMTLDEWEASRRE